MISIFGLKGPSAIAFSGAVITGFVSCVPVVLLTPKYPYAIAFPIIIGSLVTIMLAVTKTCGDATDEQDIEELADLSDCMADCVIELVSQHRELGQLDFFEKKTGSLRPNMIRVFELTESGQRLISIHGHRFVEYLVHEMVTDLDKALELSMATTFKSLRNYGKSDIFTDKLARETLKANLSKSFYTVVSRSGEKAYQRLLKECVESKNLAL